MDSSNRRFKDKVRQVQYSVPGRYSRFLLPFYCFLSQRLGVIQLAQVGHPRPHDFNVLVVLFSERSSHTSLFVVSRGPPILSVILVIDTASRFLHFYHDPIARLVDMLESGVSDQIQCV